MRETHQPSPKPLLGVTWGFSWRLMVLPAGVHDLFFTLLGQICSVTRELSSYTAWYRGLEPHSHWAETQGMWPSTPSNPLLLWQALCPQVSCQPQQQHMARLPEGTQDPLLSQQHLREP